MKGLIVSKGIGLGKAFLYEKDELVITEDKIQNTAEAIQQYESALLKTKKQLEMKISMCKGRGQVETAEVFEAHLLILQDPELDGDIRRTVTEEGYNLAYCIKEAKKKFMDMMLAIDDVYFQERAQDIDEICTSLLNNHLGIEARSLDTFEQDVVIIAKDLMPGETATLDTRHVLGIIMETGGITSHSAIIANNLGIPAMVVPTIFDEGIEEGMTIGIDCIQNRVLIEPTREEIIQLQTSRENYLENQAGYLKYKDILTRTKGGERIEIAGNISRIEDIERTLSSGAEGIGLFRSEFLYMDRSNFPSEEEQFRAYKQVVQAFEGKSVIIRTFDIGGDKHLSYYPLPKEDNPFMGYRAIRICLADRDLFETQLRAILRASHYGCCKLMFPMIASLTEVRTAKEVLGKVMADLEEAGIPFDKNIKVGIMVELPSVAASAELYTDEVDFFSIGTNDLTQYTLAADRLNEQVASIYNSYNPGVIHLIAHTIKSAVDAGIDVGMCGEMAGEPAMIPLLIGLGIDELSMSPGKVLEAKSIVQNIDEGGLSDLVKDVMAMKTANDIKDYLLSYRNNLKGGAL